MGICTGRSWGGSSTDEWVDHPYSRSTMLLINSVRCLHNKWFGGYEETTAFDQLPPQCWWDECLNRSPFFFVCGPLAEFEYRLLIHAGLWDLKALVVRVNMMSVQSSRDSSGACRALIVKLYFGRLGEFFIPIFYRFSSFLSLHKPYMIALQL